MDIFRYCQSETRDATCYAGIIIMSVKLENGNIDRNQAKTNKRARVNFSSRESERHFVTTAVLTSLWHNAVYIESEGVLSLG